jgi:hypothetical protein
MGPQVVGRCPHAAAHIRAVLMVGLAEYFDAAPRRIVLDEEGAAIYRNGRPGEYIGGLRGKIFDQLHHNRYIRRSP